MEEQKHKDQLEIIKKEKQQFYSVPSEDDYYFCEKTKSIRRKDMLAMQKYIGDTSLTTKQIKRLTRQERKKRIRDNKKQHGK